MLSGWRRASGFAFEDEMHVFMLAVLMRAGGLDELGDDAVANEPDGEPGEAAETVGCEGCAVVGSNAFGQAEFAKEP